MFSIYTLIIFTLIGAISGILVGQLSKKIVGTLKIDTSDPDKDTYLLHVDIPFDDLKRYKQVVFRVSTGSHE